METFKRMAESPEGTNPTRFSSPEGRIRLLLPERLGRLDPEPPLGGLDRGEQAGGQQEHRDGGQKDRPFPAQHLTFRKVFEQGRHPEPQGDSDRELAHRAGEEAPQDTLRAGSESGPDPDLPPAPGDGEGHEGVDPDAAPARGRSVRSDQVPPERSKGSEVFHGIELVPPRYEVVQEKNRRTGARTSAGSRVP